MSNILLTQKVLYHYTTIETLALILKNKKIRFTRADKVNDLEEIKITDLPDIKNSVFISCWTESENESIPMWALYASKARGVRIKLPTNMFKRGSDPYHSTEGNCQIINLMSLENVVQRDKVYQWIPYLFGPAIVKYSQDNSVSVLKNGELKVDKIGTVKSEHWRFEQERRFLIVPDALWNPELKRFEHNREFLTTPVNEKYIDIPLDTSALDSVEVTLGPAAAEAEHIIVETLLDQYTENGEPRVSDLKDQINMK